MAHILRSGIHRWRWPAVLALGLGAALVVAGRAIPPASGADPYVAGSELTRVSPLAGGPAAALARRAVGHERVLGLGAPAHRSVDRVVDRRAAQTYDEVTESDGRGRPTAVLRYGLDGRLMAAVRLGWGTAKTPATVTAAEAIAAAARLAQDAGNVPVGRAAASRRGSGGWTVTWPREIDGVPVPGDGLRVQLWPDGSFHALTEVNRPTAARPLTTIDRGTAETAVARWLDSWIHAPRRADARVVDASLAWVAPNDTFEPGRPDAPEPTLRLAWVVRVRASGALAETLRSLEVAIDAGAGTVLGGDILR